MKKRLEAIEATLRALLVQVEALREEAERPERPVMLNLKQAMAEYGAGREALLGAARRGEIQLHRGPHQRVLVDRAKLEAWLRSRPIRPRDRSVPADLDEWERQADEELRAMQKRR